MEPFTSAALDIFIHHARNIHNICIYANQDVYAKFSLTCSPEESVSTRIIAAAGQNPLFNDRLQLRLHSAGNLSSAVLKCELWMLSRARNFLEDQLLGFALVPLSAVAAAGGDPVTEEFSLSSTDLFHSPAGTVQLSLSFHEKMCAEFSVGNSSSISSEFVILDPCKIEFPEICVDRENQEMVSEYFSGGGVVPFVRMDCEMNVSLNDEGGVENSGLFSSSTICSVNRVSCCGSKGASPDTPTSKVGKVSGKVSSKGEEEGELGSVFKFPLGNINIEAEESAMQQQIVDMYMRSMQQFTESLAEMKLPMDLHGSKVEVDGHLMQSKKGSSNLDSNKKDGSRVFYGSRAFF